MRKSKASLNDIEFVAFDLETTGLFPISCRIVEFGAVRFRLAGTELDVFDQLVNPGCSIPRNVTRIHGITNAMVRCAPTVAEILPKFLSFIGGQGTVLLAHNASFDIGFLSMAMARQGIAFPKNPVVDTLDVSRKCLPKLGRYRLEEVARHLRVAKLEDHRGLPDSRLAMGVFRKIVSRRKQLKTLGDLFCVSSPLSFADASTLVLEPPAGFEDLTIAIAEERTVVVMYEGVARGPFRCKITPRCVVESHGRAYMTALCHYSGIEKMYRLDRIQKLWIEE